MIWICTYGNTMLWFSYSYIRIGTDVQVIKKNTCTELVWLLNIAQEQKKKILLVRLNLPDNCVTLK